MRSAHSSWIHRVAQILCRRHSRERGNPATWNEDPRRQLNVAGSPRPRGRRNACDSRIRRGYTAVVIPANAGIQRLGTRIPASAQRHWVPASAGTTECMRLAHSSDADPGDSSSLCSRHSRERGNPRLRGDDGECMRLAHSSWIRRSRHSRKRGNPATWDADSRRQLNVAGSPPPRGRRRMHAIGAFVLDTSCCVNPVPSSFPRTRESSDLGRGSQAIAQPCAVVIPANAGIRRLGTRIPGDSSTSLGPRLRRDDKECRGHIVLTIDV